jgi:hypothetical protein
MSNDLFRVLRQLGAAADVPSFLQLANCKACVDFIRNKPDSDDFRKLQRQGYSALVLAALSKGLQLFHAATAAGQRGSSPDAALLNLFVSWLSCFASVVICNVDACSAYWGEGSQLAKDMEQELLDSGATIYVCCSTYCLDRALWCRTTRGTLICIVSSWCISCHLM